MEDESSLPSYPRLRSRLSFGGIAIFVYLSLYLTWLLLGPRSILEGQIAGNLGVIFPTLVALALAWQVLRTPKGLEQRRVWIFLSIGLLAWLAGRLVSGIPAAGTWGTGVFAAAGSLRIAGFLALLSSWLVYPRQLRQSFGRLRLLLEISLTSSAVITLCWLALIRPILLAPPTITAQTPWIVIFPLLDLLLLVIFINIFALTRPARLSAHLVWLALGLLTIFFLCDFTAVGNVFLGNMGGVSVLDAGWTAGVCAIILSLIFLPDPGSESGRFPTTAVVGQKTDLFGQAAERRVQAGLPWLAVLALAGYVIFEWQLNGVSDPLGLWMMVILSVGLVARQGVLAGEMELQQYAMLVNSIAEPAFICDRLGILKMVNPALLEALGFSQPASLLGQSMDCFFLPASLAGGILNTSLNRGWSGEAIFQRQDGTSFPVYVSLRPIRTVNLEGGLRSSRLALAGTAHDLTFQKDQQNALKVAYDQVASAHRALETLNDLLEQKVEEKTSSLSSALQQLEEQNLTLQKLDELKTDFVSLVSHELRAPLTNISGGIELVLARSKELPGGTRQSLSLVQVEIRRLAHFVETILDLSALDAGRLPFSVAPLDITDVISGLKRQMASTPGVERVRWDIPDNLPLALADIHALTSVFFHLIDNGLKYAPHGELLIRIGPANIPVAGSLGDGSQWPVLDMGPLSAAEKPASGMKLASAAPFYPAEATRRVIQAQVMDHGQGIPVDALPLLFNKFSRIHRGDAQTVYGHGLGLYMVRRLLQAMGGDIRVENLPAGGACFTFWLLPVEEKDEHETAVSG